MRIVTAVFLAGSTVGAILLFDYPLFAIVVGYGEFILGLTGAEVYINADH